jgi:hypothetical protein
MSTSPRRGADKVVEQIQAGNPPHFMAPLNGPRHPPSEPPFKPDISKSHGGVNPFESVPTKFREAPPEKPESRVVLLDSVESVRYDEETQAMKEFSAKMGFGETPSKFFEDAQNKVIFEEGMSPKEQTRQRVLERLGIHAVSFRPVSAQATKTFDDYAELAKVWKAQHGIEDYGTIPPPKVERPSVICEYINTGAPITSRSGSNLTSVQREKREQAERRRKPEPHLIASYFPDGFDHGPLSDNPSPLFIKHAKASFKKEKEMVERLVERLKGKGSTYSPSRIDNLAVPLTPEARAARAADAVESRSRSRHTDPGSPYASLSPQSSRASAKIEGPQRPRYWR